MKKIALLVVFLILCVGASICSGNEIDKVKAEIAGLENQQAILEKTWLVAMNEFMEVQQDAQKTIQKADQIIENKDEGFTCDEKATLYLAAYYQQHMEKLYIVMLFLEYQMKDVEEKLADANKRLAGLREA